MLKKTTHDSSSRIRIRMYRVGFGDCFLVSFPADQGMKHILVDCGVHAKGDIHIMGQVVDDIATETGKQLAVVIATHAHQDHISGFASGMGVFKSFSVGEVWMPWTENPDDPLASKLKRKRNALAEQIQQHFQLAGGPSQASAAIQNITGNQAALQFLHSGFNGKAKQVRYLKAGDEIKSFPEIGGLAVKVLGPPTDQEFLSKMDPPAGQRYLQAVPGGAPAMQNVLQPFLPRWRKKPNAPDVKPIRLHAAEEKLLQVQLGNPSMEALAFTLDQALNNTSVVALMSFSGINLLFPGDAQYGNWKFWLEQQGSDDLLGGLRFYKVAHHGSFNATPKGALEKMAEGKFAAMVSTQNVPWASIPRMPLMKALDQRTQHQVVRSDSLAIKNAPKGPVMAHLPNDFVKGGFWYDYFLTV